MTQFVQYGWDRNRLRRRVYAPGILLICCVFSVANCFAQPEQNRTQNTGEQLTSQQVLQAIEQGQAYLIGCQNADGSWGAGRSTPFKTGTTSLCLLALLDSGLTPQDDTVAKGLQWLRRVQEPNPFLTYEVSLMISALAAAGEQEQDDARILALAQRLENGMIQGGKAPGGWDYTVGGEGLGRRPDRSNTHYAILGLRDAAHAGVPVSRETWRKIRTDWETFQEQDGGWTYNSGRAASSSGGMTVAGISSLAIAAGFLQDENEVPPKGSPTCGQPRADEAQERAYRWIAQNFSADSNPHSDSLLDSTSSPWLLSYLCGLESAGRLTGQRYFGTHDWFREGARVLLERQSKQDGSWTGESSLEKEPPIATAMAMRFLARGLASVVVGKLKFGPRMPDNPEQVEGNLWNKHPQEVHHLVEHISTLPNWPRLLSWQVLDFDKALAKNNLQELLQTPIVFVSTDEDINQLMSDKHVDLLRQYLDAGGFLFAARAGESQRFEEGLKLLVGRLYPDNEAHLLPLPETHPVYRGEGQLDPANAPLQGVEVGKRTVMIYSREDIGCLWSKRMIQNPADQPEELQSTIQRALNIGVSVVTSVTGGKPRNKLEQELR